MTRTARKPASRKKAAAKPRAPKAAKLRVSEEEERLLKSDIQSIFFTALAAMERFLGKKDPATGMAICAAGLGQSLLASSLAAELGYDAAKVAMKPRAAEPEVDCPTARKREAELTEAFFFHLHEMGLKASLKAVKPVPAKWRPLGNPAALALFVRDSEEVLFPRDPELRLKIHLTAAFRMAQHVERYLPAQTAADLFVEHFTRAAWHAPPQPPGRRRG